MGLRLKDWLITRLGGYTPSNHRLIVDAHQRKYDLLCRDAEEWVATIAKPRLSEGARFCKVIGSREHFIGFHETRELLVIGQDAVVNGSLSWGAHVHVAPWARRNYINIQQAEEA
jgi:hypothetical protein